MWAGGLDQQFEEVGWSIYHEYGVYGELVITDKRDVEQVGE